MKTNLSTEDAGNTDDDAPISFDISSRVNSIYDLIATAVYLLICSIYDMF